MAKTTSELLQEVRKHCMNDNIYYNVTITTIEQVGALTKAIKHFKQIESEEKDVKENQ